MLANDPRCFRRRNRRDGQCVAAFLMILLPANMMTMVMCVSHGRKHITERIPLSQRDGVFRHWYGAVVVHERSKWLQVNKSEPFSWL